MSAKRWTDVDIRMRPNLERIAYHYVLDYTGSFEFLANMRHIALRDGHLSISQARGVLNCMRNDATVTMPEVDIDPSERERPQQRIVRSEEPRRIYYPEDPQVLERRTTTSFRGPRWITTGTGIAHVINHQRSQTHWSTQAEAYDLPDGTMKVTVTKSEFVRAQVRVHCGLSFTFFRNFTINGRTLHREHPRQRDCKTCTRLIAKNTERQEDSE